MTRAAKGGPCPRCGDELPPDAARGSLCPGCLMQLALPDMTAGAPAAGGRIGPYDLIETIGEGGMGIVYRARQRQPLEREVALKILKPGIDSKEILARFDAERRALALMDHPNVSRVHDAGASPEGRPYFVMELIRGAPITDYCDRRRLGLSERLELFLQVCDGVQHAHQKGVIHRDLKPSNVLVAEEEGRPVSKIIDFGVAKATAGRLTALTLATEVGQILGTPEYMSPEQIDLGSDDVDTRADVYSLGVLLYELLVGAQPFDPDRLKELGYAELQRVIREENPPTPSTRATLAETSTDLAAGRGLVPGALARAVRGDLDWITMKALDKDRERRYDSAAELAADIRRHLEDQPVLAGPPSRYYRVEKFVRRHRFGVSVAALVFTFLLVLVGSTTVQARRIAEERDRASREAEVAEEVSRFLVEIFEAPDPLRPTGSDPDRRPLSALQLLDLGAARVDAELRSKPEVRLRLKVAMGSTYAGLGHYPEARELLQTTLQEARTQLGEAHPVTLEAMLELSAALIKLREHEEPLALARVAVQLYEETLGDPHLQTARAKVQLAIALYHQPWGGLEEVIELEREAIDVLRRELGAEHPETLDVVRKLAVCLILEGQVDEGEAMLEQVLDTLLRTHGESHVETAHTLHQLAFVRGRRAVHDVATRSESLEEEAALRARALEIYRSALGERHLLTLRQRVALARNLEARRMHAEAVSQLEEAIEGMSATFGAEHIETLQTRLQLARTYEDMEEFDQAVPRYRTALAAMGRVLGPEHPYLVDARGGFAHVLMYAGRHAEAEEYFLESVEAHRRLFPDSGRTASQIGFAAVNYIEMGRYRQAEELLRQALRIWQLEEDEWGIGGCAQLLLRIAWETTRDPAEAMQIWAEFGDALAEQRTVIGRGLAVAEGLEAIAGRLPAAEAESAGRLESLAARIREEET